MKKLNYKTVCGAFLAIASCVLLSLNVTSCKSAEQAIPEVDPLSVLEEDSSIYFRIPVAKHTEFVKSLMCNFVPGLTEENADLIVPKITTLCAGIGSDDDSSRVQLSADGYISPLSVKVVITEKNGWTSNKADVSGSIATISVPYTYYTRSDTEYQLSLPSLKNLVLAENVEPLLSRYNDQLSAINSTGFVQTPSDNWTSTTYEWMTTASDDIRFCVLKPQAFLAGLLGTEMRFALVCARGSFAELENGTYNLSLELEFQSTLVVKAAQLALNLLYGKTASISSESTIIKIADINFTQDQILQLIK